MANKRAKPSAIATALSEQELMVLLGSEERYRHIAEIGSDWIWENGC